MWSIKTQKQIVKALSLINKMNNDDLLYHSPLCNYGVKRNRNHCNCGVSDCLKAFDMIQQETTN